MGKIYLIRHGFTPANNANYNGQRNLREIAEDENMPLDKKYGVSQAIELGKFLNTIKGKTLILVSPYLRTRQTLEYALTQMQVNYDELIVDDLHEINSGIHYAKTKEEVLEEYPEALDFYENINQNPLETKFIEGESQYDVRDRVQKISKTIVELSEIYDNIFVFAHGSVNSWIYYWINGERLNHAMKNCEVVETTNPDPIFIPEPFAPKGYIIPIEEYVSNVNQKRLTRK